MLNSWLINWHDAERENPQENRMLIMLFQQNNGFGCLIGMYKNGNYYFRTDYNASSNLDNDPIVNIECLMRIAFVKYWDYIPEGLSII